MKRTLFSITALALLAAGCGGEATNQRAAAPRTSDQSTQAVTLTTTSTPSRCTVRHLSLRLGTATHSTGSTYRPIVFTNTGSATCTLRGYPGVSYVAPSTGAQVGAAATRNSAVSVRTITLAPNHHAASLLQLVDYLNFPAARCDAKPVSGLRVYPPGSKASAVIHFAHNHMACSSDVEQLSVRAVVKGQTGQ